MARALTSAFGKLEDKMLAISEQYPSYTEQLGYTDLNLAHGDASMQSVATGLQQFMEGIGSLSQRQVESCKVSYTFTMEEITDQWDT